MRLVKATRRLSRRGVALAALAVIVAACDPVDGGIPDAAALHGAADADDLCLYTATLPRRPRLVGMTLHGAPDVWRRTVCAACLAAHQGAWASGDLEVIEVDLGDQWLAVPNEPRSALRASHALKGAALGIDSVLLDLGDTWQLRSRGRPPLDLLPLPMQPGQTIWSVHRSDWGITVEVRADHRPGPVRLPLVATSAEALREDLLPLDTPRGVRVGSVLRALEGAARVELAPTESQTIPLGDTRRVAHAELVGDVLVTWGATGAAVAHSGRPVERLAPTDTVLTDEDRVLWIDQQHRRVSVATAGAWRTIWAASPGLDFGGALLPGDARSKRLAGALSGGQVAVVERILERSCQVQDLLHVMDLETGDVRSVARGPGMRMHLSAIDGGFVWVEADAVSERF